MICRGKGENKEYSNKVIGEVLEHWDEIVCGITNNANKEKYRDDIQEENILS